MRILHTSDWHLGRSFGPHSLVEDQAAFLDWLVTVVRDEAIDLVTVAGDVYDRAIPPTTAIVAFREVLQRLRAEGARVAVITGNHDSVERVSPYDTLVDGSGVFIRAGFTRAGEVVQLPFSDGPLDIVAVPYLDPQLAPLPSDADTDTDTDRGPGSHVSADTTAITPPTHHSVLAHALAAARQRLRSRRSVVLAHVFVGGSVESESERQLTVGGTGQVDRALFSGFSYVALGHLHRPQRAGSDRVRYSGSPLAYSFSEQHRKSVVLVDMDRTGSCNVTTLPVPVGRPVLTVEGRLDDLCRAAPTVAHQRAFVRAVLTDCGVIVDARARLIQHYPHLAEIELRPGGDALHDGPMAGASRPATNTNPLLVVREFWNDVCHRPPTPAEESLLAAAFDATRVEEVTQ